MDKRGAADRPRPAAKEEDIQKEEDIHMITNDHPGIGALVLDVADPASVARAAEAVALSHPGLNVLVNNAGIRDQGSAALLRREPARAVRDAEADGRYGDLLAMLGNVG